MLMKTSAQSLTEQLAERFAERIRNRLLAPGARLPSVRQCALQHAVSPSTVVAAYDQLLAQGLVEARKNRGFFVREAATARTQDRSTSAPLAVPRGGDRYLISTTFTLPPGTTRVCRTGVLQIGSTTLTVVPNVSLVPCFVVMP